MSRAEASVTIGKIGRVAHAPGRASDRLGVTGPWDPTPGKSSLSITKGWTGEAFVGLGDATAGEAPGRRTMNGDEEDMFDALG